MSDSKSPLAYKTLLSILDNLNHVVFWMVSILLLIYNSISLFSKPLEPFLNAPTTWYDSYLQFFQLSNEIQVLFFVDYH